MNAITVFYDGDCALCTRWARRGRALGFRCEPMADGRAAHEMKVRTTDGRELGGAEAIAFLCRQVWMLWPVWALSRMPGAMSVVRWGYRRVAAHRHCTNGKCVVSAEDLLDDLLD